MTTSDNKFTVNCISCKPEDAKEKARTIIRNKFCKVVLRTDNQCWLGRYIVVPLEHFDPLDFWMNEVYRSEVMKMHVTVAKAIQKVFGATCVQMAQLGGLTVDEKNNPTSDQRYQHAHIHGIPRYDTPPKFLGKQWPDPQYRINPQTKKGEFSALNIDPKAGLPKVVPTDEEVVAIVAAIVDAL